MLDNSKWTDENTGLHWWLYAGRFDVPRTWEQAQETPEDIEDGYVVPTREQVETIMDDSRVQHIEVWTNEEVAGTVAWACNFKDSNIYKRDKSSRKDPLYVKINN